MSLASGSSLGQYAILSPFGAGGMGEVYKANDTRLDRTVAIKVLPEHLASDGRFLMNVAVEGATAPPITVVLNWDAALKK